MTIGKKIREIRKIQGLNQVDLASKADVTQTYISFLERNKIDNVGVFTIRRIASALGYSIDEFMEGINEKTDV